MIRQISTWRDLESLTPHWQRLASGQPFLSPAWLAVWWRHFGSFHDRRLAVLVVEERGEPVAIAPWYLEPSLLHGPTLRFLGSGAICTDYLSLACQRGYEQFAAEAIADWLCGSPEGGESGDAQAWELLCLEGVSAHDQVMRLLRDALVRQGALAHERPAANCWRVALPASWDEYLAMLSKSHRKRVRRLERAYFQNGRARLVCAATPEELERGFDVLVDLHSRRWALRGGSNAFEDPALLDFHCQATSELQAGGQLRLAWLELDGQPVAAEYSLLGDGTIYAYQSGMDPAAEQHEPGTLALIALLKAAIEEGYREVDFLRGDEAYKLHWGVEPRPCYDLRIVPNRWPIRLRDTLWQAASSAKSWLRTTRDAAQTIRRGGAPPQPASTQAAP